MFKNKKLKKLEEQVEKNRKELFFSSFELSEIEGDTLKKKLENSVKTQKDTNSIVDERTQELKTEVDKLNLKFNLLLTYLGAEYIKQTEEKDGKQEIKEIIREKNQPISEKVGKN
jgi:hypothetical protein